MNLLAERFVFFERWSGFLEEKVKNYLMAVMSPLKLANFFFLSSHLWSVIKTHIFLKLISFLFDSEVQLFFINEKRSFYRNSKFVSNSILYFLLIKYRPRTSFCKYSRARFTSFSTTDGMNDTDDWKIPFSQGYSRTKPSDSLSRFMSLFFILADEEPITEALSPWRWRRNVDYLRTFSLMFWNKLSNHILCTEKI